MNWILVVGAGKRGNDFFSYANYMYYLDVGKLGMCIDKLCMCIVGAMVISVYKSYNVTC
jgi:hypothetical protein